MTCEHSQNGHQCFCGEKHYESVDRFECKDMEIKALYADLDKSFKQNVSLLSDLSKRDAIIKVCVEKFNAIVKHQEIVVGKGFARLSTTAAIANGAILEIERLKKEQR